MPRSELCKPQAGYGIGFWMITIGLGALVIIWLIVIWRAIDPRFRL